MSKKQSNGSAFVHEGCSILPCGQTLTAVSLVLGENRTIKDVASSLGLGESTLGKWVRQARIDTGEREGLTTSEKTELAELRREVRQLRMERELLKRATAFWVKEAAE